MTGVLESPKIEETANGEALKDTWLLELPPETCDREGFARGTLVSLTIKDGGISTSFVRPPSKKLQAFASEILAEDDEFFEEMKRRGD